MSDPDKSSAKAIPEAVRTALEPRYQIEARAAEGESSTVYRARDVELDRRVSIKVLRASLLTPETRDRFVREGQIMASLEHPNLLRIHDVGESSGVVFQAQEWIEGATLAQILERDGPLDLREALVLGRAVGGALEVAHDQDILHRDVKPSNVLVPVDESGRRDFANARLADFGVFGNVRRSTGFTMVGQFFGTPFYMAPEQITAGAQSRATDVWGLGALLYEAIMGRRPFEASNLMELFQAVLNEPVRFPPEAALPPAVEQFLRQCLDKDPDRRPKRPVDALEELLSPAEATGAAAEPEAWEAPAASPGPPSPSLPFPAQSPPGPDRESSSPRPLSPRGGRHSLVSVALAGTLVVASVAAIAAGLTWAAPSPGLDLAAGAALLVTGVAMGLLVHRWLVRRGAGLRAGDRPALALDSSREELSQTMAVLVDDLAAECRKVDEKVLCMSVAFMVNQLKSLESFSDRKDALLTAMELMDRLRDLRTPWWVRHDKWVALAVATAGVLTGAVKILEALREL